MKDILREPVEHDPSEIAMAKESFICPHCGEAADDAEYIGKRLNCGFEMDGDSALCAFCGFSF